ncbi:MAG: FAD-dependent oxidoreductase, partial [Rhizobiaceae bacterium]|nr:FAD-dependent oxidoreductase [Rhizobiaceae bacterium]
FVSLTIDNDKTPAHPGDSIVLDGKVVGTITSAGWGYRVGQNIAYAFVDPDVTMRDDLSVQHVGQLSAVKIDDMCRYDPQNALVRS